MPTPTDIPARLRLIREAAKLTQPQLAERIGCSSKTISNIEAGRRGSNVPMMSKWAEACGRTLAVEFRVAAEAESQALAARVAEAPPRTQEVIDALLDGASAAPDAAIGALEEHVRAWMTSVGVARPPHRARRPE